MRTDDRRFEELTAWLKAHFGAADFVVTVASADASFRRYFRVARNGATWIAMDAPPEKEDMGPYVRVAEMLGEIGVNAPRILVRDAEHGFLLNSDLGSEMYLTALADAARAEELYGAALDALVHIQSRGTRYAATLPPYDEALLHRELQLFPEWFCERHLGLRFSAEERAGLERVGEFLIRGALEQPRVFVHRDYHSRNLMVSGGAHGSAPGILDFQDAVFGPLTYDLVSLLKDCYIAWPRERVDAWVRKFRRDAANAGLDVGADDKEFRRWFELMGVQRHLKAIGIFARLWHRDGKPGYLNDIPRVLKYVTEVARETAELAPLAELVTSRVQPVLEHLAPSRR